MFDWGFVSIKLYSPTNLEKQFAPYVNWAHLYEIPATNVGPQPLYRLQHFKHRCTKLLNNTKADIIIFVNVCNQRGEKRWIYWTLVDVSIWCQWKCAWSHPCLAYRCKVAPDLCKLNRGLLDVAVTSHAWRLNLCGWSHQVRRSSRRALGQPVRHCCQWQHALCTYCSRGHLGGIMYFMFTCTSWFSNSLSLLWQI